MRRHAAIHSIISFRLCCRVASTYILNATINYLWNACIKRLIYCQSLASTRSRPKSAQCIFILYYYYVLFKSLLKIFALLTWLDRAYKTLWVHFISSNLKFNTRLGAHASPSRSQSHSSPAKWNDLEKASWGSAVRHFALFCSGENFYPLACSLVCYCLLRCGFRFFAFYLTT